MSHETESRARRSDNQASVRFSQRASRGKSIDIDTRQNRSGKQHRGVRSLPLRVRALHFFDDFPSRSIRSPLVQPKPARGDMNLNLFWNHKDREDLKGRRSCFLLCNLTNSDEVQFHDHCRDLRVDHGKVPESVGRRIECEDSAKESTGNHSRSDLSRRVWMIIASTQYTSPAPLKGCW